MKNLIYFMLGFGVGAAGCFLWLHKEIKKIAEKQAKEAEVPFTVDENGKNGENEANEKASVSAVEGPTSDRNEAKVQYNEIVKNTVEGHSEPPTASWGSIPVPVMPREEEKIGMGNEDLEKNFITPEPGEEGIFEIDEQEYLAETGDEKEFLMWFRGDHILCEENGTIISNPVMLIGNGWTQYVGHYAHDTAFVKNARLCTKYEIKCEEGLYTDEFPSYDG